MLKRLFLFATVVSLAACAPQPYKATNKVYKQQAKHWSNVLKLQPDVIPADSVAAPALWAGTTNFNLRKPNFVIIHHTAQQSCEQTLRTFTLERTQVSAHYVICEDGTIHHMLNDYLRAWHGGVARWGSMTDINSSSIGIELDNDGHEPFAAPQIRSLLTLLDTLKHRYNVPAANFIGHGDIAPKRKVDPSRYFPWDTLAAKGFGLWYGDTSLVQVPGSFNTLMALRTVGYDMKDTTASIDAFKRHFIPSDTLSPAGYLDERGKKILISILEQHP
ncbi:N-acetylmuramoyl-L-alanine amidase [Chitinophaga alhagiae]|uniref:N-acetylmuramoyl-L-alanine amidase n=1 Tax=Chitinophaga alhagiae TaxID=2203219 RepID=UPI000E5BD35B|nr:N-acetylmuramoyl-L-alanine amidase [Chitinophaga alhagiae]